MERTVEFSLGVAVRHANRDPDAVRDSVTRDVGRPILLVERSVVVSDCLGMILSEAHVLSSSLRAATPLMLSNAVRSHYICFFLVDYHSFESFQIRFFVCSLRGLITSSITFDASGSNFRFGFISTVFSPGSYLIFLTILASFLLNLV